MATLSAMFCRLSFLVGCAGPTSVVFYACLFGTVDENDVRERFAAASGYSLKFASISEPRPGRLLAEDVEILDPETGDVALAARTVEIESNGVDFGVIVSDAKLVSPRFSDFRTLSEEALVRFAGDDAANVWIELGSVSFDAVQRDGGPALPAETFRDVAVHLVRAGANEPRRDRSLTVEFRRSDRPEAERATLRLERYSESGVVHSAWSLDTGLGGLPCSFLARWSPELASLGPNAAYYGKARFAEDSQGLTGDFAGVFDRVDLHSLVTARFPHKLSGEGRLTIHRCRWEGGRLAGLTAELTVGKGVIGRSLIDSFHQSLNCRVAESQGLEELSPFLLFDQLGLAIELTADGRCRLSGQLAPEGTLLKGANGPLLSEGARDYLPASRFVQALAPQSDLQVPASEATRELVGWLPLAKATSDDATGPPRAVVRMGE